MGQLATVDEMNGFDSDTAVGIITSHREALSRLADEGFSADEILCAVGYLMVYGDPSSSSPFEMIPLAVAEDDYSLHSNPAGWDLLEGREANWMISHKSLVIVHSPYSGNSSTTMWDRKDSAGFVEAAAEILSDQGISLSETDSCTGCDLCSAIGRS